MTTPGAGAPSLVEALRGPVNLYGDSFGGTLAAEAALRARNLKRRSP